MLGAEGNQSTGTANPALFEGHEHRSWQEIPLPFRPKLALGAPRFAHPFEAEFARLLDYYRTPWSYEPTTFALAWDDAGRPLEFCTPDFYLPEQRLYVELTTVRQCLVTPKHRKVRLLRAQYPGVNIRLLYRRDYERLLLAHDESEAAERAGTVLFSAGMVERRVVELATAIALDGAGTPGAPPLLLAAGPGATTFMTALVQALDDIRLAYDVDAMTLSPFRRGAVTTRRKVELRRRPLHDPRGRRVIVVEGVVSTGLSLAYMVRWLRRRGAKSIDVCTLLDRQAARVADVPLTYTGFEAPHEIVVGYGLTRRRRFRDLPFIARLERDS